MLQCSCAGQREAWWACSPSFGSGNWTHVIEVLQNAFYPLCHLAGPWAHFFFKLSRSFSFHWHIIRKGSNHWPVAIDGSFFFFFFLVRFWGLGFFFFFLVFDFWCVYHTKLSSKRVTLIFWSPCLSSQRHWGYLRASPSPARHSFSSITCPEFKNGPSDKPALKSPVFPSGQFRSQQLQFRCHGGSHRASHPAAASDTHIDPAKESILSITIFILSSSRCAEDGTRGHT